MQHLFRSRFIYVMLFWALLEHHGVLANGVIGKNLCFVIHVVNIIS